MKLYTIKPIVLSVITLLFISSLGNALAQDTLKFRTGNLLSVKVLEITPTLIKYKKVENESGPTYSDLKNDIEYVKFKNGQIELFEIQQPVVAISLTKKGILPSPVKTYPPLTKIGNKFSYGNSLIGNGDMYNVLLSLNNKKITNHIKLAKEQRAWQYIGFAAIPCAIGALTLMEQANSTWKTSDSQEFATNASIVALIGIACISTSITMKVKRNKNEQAALRLYQLNY